ncbi:P-loop containing nucleoside triphosphate hydrolase protein [Nemania serpens]|nr:P-loop containing nucleoside triphosphate hydrolase protein [Nemania serpens]
MADIFEVEAANFMAFVGARPPKSDSVFLLVMGMTGSGKSSFIADCTGREDVEIGHDLESCTNFVAIFRQELYGRDVYLIDTPGFDDANQEDVEILTAVAHYLSVSYANNVSVNGILYLHRISDTRIGSSTKRNLEMMRALCGADAFENVAVVTTMWRSNDSELELAKQRSREEELRETYLRDMIESGSRIIRHDRCNTLSERRTSAKDILFETVGLWQDTQVTLQIQHEMVDLKMTLKETSAGKVLERYIQQHQSSHGRDLERLVASLSNLTYYDSNEIQLHASTHVLADSQSKEIQRLLTENNRALEAMRLSLVEIHIKQEQKFLRRVSVMENEWKEALRWREEEYRLKELEYRTRQREQESRLRELDYRTRQLEEREIVSEEIRVNTLQLQASSYPVIIEVSPEQHPMWESTKQRDRATEKELERLRLEVEKLRLETASKLDTAEKVKHEWNGLLLQGLVTGGLGIVGSVITAGMLCCVQ